MFLTLYDEGMDKIIWCTMVVTVTESWTITWADGTEHRVVYRAGQFIQTKPDDADDRQAANDPPAIAIDPDQPSHEGGGGA